MRIPPRFSCTRPESSEKPSWTSSDSARSRPESRQATARTSGQRRQDQQRERRRLVDHAGEPDQAGAAQHQQRARSLRDQLAHQPDVVDRARHQVAGAVAGEEGRSLAFEVGVEPIPEVVGDGDADPADRAAADQDRGETPGHAGGDPGADRQARGPPGRDPIDAGAEKHRDGGFEQPRPHQQRIARRERQPVAPVVGQEAPQRMHRVERESSYPRRDVDLAPGGSGARLRGLAGGARLSAPRAALRFAAALRGQLPRRRGRGDLSAGRRDPALRAGCRRSRLHRSVADGLPPAHAAADAPALLPGRARDAVLSGARPARTGGASRRSPPISARRRSRAGEPAGSSRAGWSSRACARS